MLSNLPNSFFNSSFFILTFIKFINEHDKLFSCKLSPISKHFNSYFGDGVIISSAMGSTAYNMSAGGPIIHPLCDAYSVTPICSHSLTQRPLVLPREFRLEFRSNDDVVVLIDGQDRFDLIEFDSVDIGVSDIRVNLLRQKGRDYFGVLKEKLRWGQQ